MKRVFLNIILMIFYFVPISPYADDHKENDVIMIANGDFDVFIETNENELRPILDELDIKIGDTKIVSLDYLDNLISKFNPIKSSFGGSAANTAYILSSLEKKNGIYVILSDEKIAKDFIQDLANVGVKNYGAYISDKDRGNDSAMTKVVSFISHSGTEKSERTFIAYKGLSADFSKTQFDLSHIKNYKILYIEGYIFSPKSRDVVFKAIEEAKRNNVKVLFSPSNPVFVNLFKEDFQKIIDLSDIVFTNHGEIESLYGDGDINESISKFSKRVDIAIITNGRKGSKISSGYGKNIVDIYEPIDQLKAIDTTGAGDGYLAGFLYGYLNGNNIEKSGKMGAIVANHVIQEISGRPSEEMLGNIRQALLDQ